MFTQLEYDRLYSDILDAKEFYRSLYSTSPTLHELSKMTGASEENILESMEFAVHPNFQYVS